ncbi:hypothetical protein ERJ75_001395600 [Trypanosoma vivax]|nr:hypothetical protein ERJ75_001395600 [Trypanosoma vivax]
MMRGQYSADERSLGCARDERARTNKGEPRGRGMARRTAAQETWGGVRARGTLRARRKLCGKENQRRGERRCSQTAANGRASGKHEADMSGTVDMSRQIEMRSGCVCKDAFDCGIVERRS